jgi:hypothetical protein
MRLVVRFLPITLALPLLLRRGSRKKPCLASFLMSVPSLRYLQIISIGIFFTEGKHNKAATESAFLHSAALEMMKWKHMHLHIILKHFLRAYKWPKMYYQV